MKINVKAIDIRAFRGIPSLKLNIDNKNLLLRGENATGKSSFVEALEFFFTGKLAIFEGEGTKDLSLKKHAPHANFSWKDLSVKLTFDPGKITLERTLMKNPESRGPLYDYFHEAQKGTFILRRSQILRFIASVPADRFRAIASLIGIERLDNVELTLKRVFEELEENAHLNRQAIQDAFEKASKLLDKKVITSQQVLLALNSRLRKVGLTELESYDNIDNATDEMLKTFKESRDLDYVKKLGETLEELKVLKIKILTNESLRDFNEKIAPYLASMQRIDVALEDLLSSGQRVVQELKTDQCPLCQQEISRQGLLKQIEERLNTLSQLSEEASELKQLSIDIIGKVDRHTKDLKEISQHLEQLEEFGNEIKKLEKFLEFSRRFVNNVRTAAEVGKRVSEEDLEQHNKAVGRFAKSLQAKCQKMFDEVGVPDDWKAKTQAIALANQIKVTINGCITLEKSIKKEEKRVSIARKIFKTFSSVKKERISHLYESITGDVNSYYSILHPGEPHKNIEIRAIRRKRASTTLRIESFGTVADPRAFTREGHLDSLGLCIFLAFVKRFNRKCNFVVLDDVVTTIDSKHREHICEILLEHFADYQLFVTTHDLVWYDQLCAHQRAYSASGKFKNMEIIRWTLDTGPVIEPYKAQWDRIDNKIQSGDKMGAASEGGHYLESTLKRVCVALMARPIMKIGGYTVGDLLAPAKDRVSKLLDHSQFRNEILKCFGKLEATVIMRNLLIHDNPYADNVSIHEVRRFCEAVHELSRVFKYPDCGEQLKYYQDMKRIRCPNPRCLQQIDITCK